MRKKTNSLPILVAIYLFGSIALFATNSPAIVTPSFGTPTLEGVESACNLPAPENFHVTAITSMSISAAWNSVPGAQQYYLELYEAGGSTAIHSVFVQDTFGTVPVSKPGYYDLYVSAVAPGCRPSENRAIVPNLGVIIAELTLDFAPTIQGLPVHRSVSEGCFTVPFKNIAENNAEYGFQVLYAPADGPADVSNYLIDLDAMGANPELKVGHDLTEVPSQGGFSTYAKGRNLDGWGLPSVPNLEEMRVYDPNWGEGDDAHIYSVYFEKTGNPSDPKLQVCFCRNVPETEPYQIQFFSSLNLGEEGAYYTEHCQGDLALPGPGAGNNSAVGRSAAAGGVLSNQFTVLNPFLESLHIVSTYTGDDMVILRLFDLNGRLVAEQKGPAAQEYDLPTSQLTPGMYVLRIENGDTYQTFKVVKLH